MQESHLEIKTDLVRVCLYFLTPVLRLGQALLHHPAHFRFRPLLFDLLESLDHQGSLRHPHRVVLGLQPSSFRSLRVSTPLLRFIGLQRTSFAPGGLH